MGNSIFDRNFLIQGTNRAFLDTVLNEANIYMILHADSIIKGEYVFGNKDLRYRFLRNPFKKSKEDDSLLDDYLALEENAQTTRRLTYLSHDIREILFNIPQLVNQIENILESTISLGKSVRYYFDSKLG